MGSKYPFQPLSLTKTPFSNNPGMWRKVLSVLNKVIKHLKLFLGVLNKVIMHLKTFLGVLNKVIMHLKTFLSVLNKVIKHLKLFLSVLNKVIMHLKTFLSAVNYFLIGFWRANLASNPCFIILQKKEWNNYFQEFK